MMLQMVSIMTATMAFEMWAAFEIPLDICYLHNSEFGFLTFGFGTGHIVAGGATMP